MAKSAEKTNGSEPAVATKAEFPKFNLEQALVLAQALERNGGQPLPPIDAATAVDRSPGSSAWRQLTAASNKYGLTIGSYKAARISMQDLGRSIMAPKSPEERATSLVDAALRPAAFKHAYDYYKGKRFPERQFFEGAAHREFGVPKGQAKAFVEVFTANMRYVGLLKETPGGAWLGTEATPPSTATTVVVPDTGDSEAGDEAGREEEAPSLGQPEDPTAGEETSKPSDLTANRRVFITHGKNLKIVEQVKELLEFGNFEPVVSAQKETVAKPVPDKVMDDMRLCAAAVIHVGTEMTVLDTDGKEHMVLNQNVLIEIGAAMALYGRKFILLVETGATLPSNLQGLYEVRYEGDGLDHDSTVKLLRAFNDFKS